MLLLQIRDSISVKERLDVDDNPPTTLEWALRGFQFFFSPIDGASSARYSSSAFRDDQDVDILGDVFTDLTKGTVVRPESFFTTAIFENSATVALLPPPDWPKEDNPLENKKMVGEPRDVSMTWYLTRAEIQALIERSPAIRSPARNGRTPSNGAPSSTTSATKSSKSLQARTRTSPALQPTRRRR